MSSRRKKSLREQSDIALQKFEAGYKMVTEHPLFHMFTMHVSTQRKEMLRYPEHGLVAALRTERKCFPDEIVSR